MGDLLLYTKKVIPYVRPYWRLAAGSALLTLLSTALGLLTPWPMKVIVDSIIGGEPLPGAMQWFVGPSGSKGTLLALTVLAGLALSILLKSLSTLTGYLDTKLSMAVTFDVRADLFQQAQRLSLSYHDSVKSGRLIFTINLASSAIGLMMMLLPLAHNLLTLVGMFWISYRINHTLALISLSVVPILYLSGGYYTKIIRARLTGVQGSEANLTSIVHEAIAMLRVIVAFGREDHEFDRFRQEGRRAYDARIRITLQQSLFSLAVETATAIGSAAVLGYGSYLVLTSRMTTGELLIVLAYIASVFGPLQAISGTMAHLQGQLVGLRRMFTFLEAVPEVQDAPGATAIEHCEGRVVFEDVSFHYQGRQSTLQHISIDVAPGKAIALVGATGAGKSTLVSLLPRFYDPVEGRILLDGVDIRTLTLRSLRHHISIVLQEPLLFSGSIADNIRYGRLEATMDEVMESAKAANAHDFIMALPEKYDTLVGDRGKKLSGGERQRVAVARAFLKDAPILILDEPTSSIDSKTEAVILDALDRLMMGRTTFVVAHRLSTLRNVDRILVLNHGCLVEHGTHDELLALGGIYRQLSDVQTGGVRKRVSPTPGAEPASVPVTDDAHRT